MDINLSLTCDLPVILLFERAPTDEEFLELCARNEPLAMEREPDGAVFVMSPTGTEGGSAELRVAMELGIWARVSGAGEVFGSNAGFRLPDSSVRAADAALVVWSRWDALTSNEREGYAPLAPDFVMELRSKSDRLPPLQKKMEQWMANGVKLGWLIDPVERAVHIYRSGEEIEVHHDPSSVQGTGVMAGFQLVMATVWK